jgi:hypothetical protein
MRTSDYAIDALYLQISNDHLVYRTLVIPALNWVTANHERAADDGAWTRAFSGVVIRYLAYTERARQAYLKALVQPFRLEPDFFERVRQARAMSLPRAQRSLAEKLGQHWQREYQLNQLDGIINQPSRLDTLHRTTDVQSDIMARLHEAGYELLPTMTDPTDPIEAVEPRLMYVRDPSGAIVRRGDDINDLLKHMAHQLNVNPAPGA